MFAWFVFSLCSIVISIVCMSCCFGVINNNNNYYYRIHFNFGLYRVEESKLSMAYNGLEVLCASWVLSWVHVHILLIHCSGENGDRNTFHSVQWGRSGGSARMDENETGWNGWRMEMKFAWRSANGYECRCCFREGFCASAHPINETGYIMFSGCPSVSACVCTCVHTSVRTGNRGRHSPTGLPLSSSLLLRCHSFATELAVCRRRLSSTKVCHMDFVQLFLLENKSEPQANPAESIGSPTEAWRDRYATQRSADSPAETPESQCRLSSNQSLLM